MKRLALLFAWLVAAAVLAGACGTQGGGTQQEVGKLQRESKSVDPKDAQSVRAELKMGAGELNLTGGADNLMEGDFSYNVAEWKPKVSYDVSGEEGDLLVKQGGEEGSNLSGKARNEWEIRLNDELPTDLVVQMGAGESDLDLDSLTLKALKLQMGAGETTVDLTGDYARSFDASIQGGVGEATVELPSGVGVKAKAQGGLGEINAGEGLKKVGDSYVNDAYGESDVTINVKVQGSVGEINLEVV
jgi:hypothetical protein